MNVSFLRAAGAWWICKQYAKRDWARFSLLYPDASGEVFRDLVTMCNEEIVRAAEKTGEPEPEVACHSFLSGCDVNDARKRLAALAVPD